MTIKKKNEIKLNTLLKTNLTNDQIVNLIKERNSL